MDTSEIYIKQCDCPEIQGQWKKEQYGDILACYNKKRIYEDGTHYYSLLLAGGPPLRKSKNRIWLPRQDDIQEMMNWHEPDRVHQWLLKFFYFLTNEIGIDVSIFKTAE